MNALLGRKNVELIGVQNQTASGVAAYRLPIVFLVMRALAVDIENVQRSDRKSVV